MAQGDFTKEEAKETAKAVGELFEAIPKGKKPGYLGHLNDIYLFLSACEQKATAAEPKRMLVPPA